MHGIVFFLFQRFAENTLGQDAWSTLFDESGIPPKSYSPSKAHADEDFLGLVGAASRLAGKTQPEFLEAFGEYLGPEFLTLHARLIQPEWRALDVVANAEEVIHTVVRAKNPGALPPVLRTQRTSPAEVQLVYSSERRVCALAKGMVKGLASHFDEQIEIQEDMCMLDGDPFCTMSFIKTGSTAAAAAPSEEGHPGTAGAVVAISAPDSDPAVGDGTGEMAWQRAATPAPEGRDAERWLGTYRVIDLLGRGGMGLVYLAEDPALQRKVAIKALRDDLARDKSMRERFFREARSMAALDHPHIIPIFHVGRHEGTPYMVMPRLRGADLATWLADGNLPSVLQALRIARETASALRAAHARKVVHRDIKPANIWLEAPKGHVKLMDFGLCRFEEEITGLTMSGAVMGTPLYMAPESFHGSADERSDLYALGTVMYELLGGSRPFEGNSLTELVQEVATEVPASPRRADLDVPSDLGDLVLLLLAKDPDDRVQTADELCERLGDIYEGLTTREG